MESLKDRCIRAVGGTVWSRFKELAARYDLTLAQMLMRLIERFDGK